MTASDSGAISTTIEIPKDAPAGDWVVSALGADSQVPARVTVTIKAPAPVAEKTATTLVASPEAPAIGEVTGAVAAIDVSFGTNEQVKLVLHSDPVSLTTVNADAQGGFSQVVTIPANTAAGKHEIVATGTDSDRSASANVKVTVTSGGNNGSGNNGTGNGSGNDLSFTGAQVGGLVLTAIIALAAGVVLVSIRRRHAGE